MKYSVPFTSVQLHKPQSQENKSKEKKRKEENCSNCCSCWSRNATVFMKKILWLFCIYHDLPMKTLRLLFHRLIKYLSLAFQCNSLNDREDAYLLIKGTDYNSWMTANLIGYYQDNWR